MSELIIDDTNFNQYFRDVLTNRPQPGDVMASYKAVAELRDGELKEQIVESLFLENIGPKKAVTLMTKLGKAPRQEAIKLVKKIFMDLYNGMSKPMVISKTYEYLFEIFYYTKEEYVPRDDKHWEIVKIQNLDQYFNKNDINNSQNITTVNHGENNKESPEAVCQK